MTIREVISEIEKLIDMPQAEDFDNVGLLCGLPERNVSGMLICHDALENIVDEAIQRNCNFIVCFHPIIFSGLKSLTGKNYVERAVLKAIENKVAIYAIHTAFDNDFQGVNAGICNLLGLKDLKILQPKKNNLKQLNVYVPNDHSENVKEALFSAGAGNIGFYDECSYKVEGNGTFRPIEGSNPFSGEQYVRENAKEDMLSVIFEAFKQNQIVAAMKSAHPYEEVAHQIYSLENENQYSGLGMYGEFEIEMDEKEFLGFVKEKFNVSIIKHSDLNQKKIKRVGVLGGSGASGIKSALSKKCDAYLTGDLKYHDYFLAESKMLICDIGHYESEQLVSQQLFEILSQKFSTFAILKSSEKTNPVNYFL
ncbi:Nif3-like dinuclear metal center hexameric protein [Chryseobacterium chendengshani]|uniref:Nif3-like dinuclear metal center hexameric protein n=1 Tax=unclassified Chryseobacterium TaxID=2593645 RepID=UPI001C64088F|nr:MULTISPECIES: Nif3-like dinuclear metal center hexameric protein [unclassified Chryseobacterium]MBW7674991.1 Nif3-like dinuclear metal center hexameric protein [Chryseobacterium sp. LJ756]MBW8523397.1 Nif3-like dinuclear metal center hexameric protein [Chryseobacterium sp. LJ668]QYK15685.1 Nif3-like dinuclear metal center hexameric protein [Chryseobacterium sp. LJ668]